MQIQSPILATRNFYGVLTIQEMNRDEWAALRLAHGRILHGFQFRDPRKSSLPTSYYGAGSGVGKVLSAMKENSSQQNNLRIGVIGLGVGTLAAYAQAGDYVRFYEINPDVVRLATDPQYFTYLRNCPAKSTIMIGDARLSMEAELRRNQSQGFDVLVVDAFSGDAPPVHLLTREALEVYLKELKPGGILAVNVTNTFINLQPVVATLAQNLHLDYSLFHSDGDGRISFYSDWALLSEEPISDRLGSVVAGTSKPQPSGRVWTDDYSNLFAILR